MHPAKRLILAPLKGVGGFSPLSLFSRYGSGLWLRASDIVGHADGGAISTNWSGRVGGINAAPTSGPLYRSSVMGGRPGVEFNSAGRKFVTDAFLTVGFNTSFSFYAVVKKIGASLAVYASHAATQFYAGADAATLMNTAGTSDSQTSRVGPWGSGGLLHGFRYNGTRKVLDVFGPSGFREAAEAATGNLALSGTLTLGDLSSGGFVWDGQLCEVLAFPGFLSEADHLELVNYLAVHYGLAAPSTALRSPTATRVYFDGNSLTHGVGVATDTDTYPAQTLALLGSQYAGVNLGVSSATTAVRSANAAAAINANYSATRTNVAVLWEITNDLYFGGTAADAITRYAAWCSAVRASGFKVVAVTVLPRSNVGTPGTFEADRQTVNTSIRANWATYADALADVAADTRIGDAGDETNTTYYGDLVHMTTAGYGVVAGIVRPAILTL